MVSKTTAEVTRVAAGDDGERYDGLEMTLHWLTAVLVVALFGLAETWDFAPRGSVLRHGMQDLHVSLGLSLIVVILARIAWRIGPGRRVRPATSGLVELASRIVHYALYGLLLIEVVLGVLFRWANHDPLSLFGLLTIPAAVDFSKDGRHLIGEAHNYVAITIVALAGLHAAAALFHHYWLRDNVLWRMLPGLRARQAERRRPEPETIERRAARP
ncbi:MAG TPA: cytochrome b [Lichenihabitans sp.]|jgi:cytochrome b561|nr:cytochrome b [Lichenihabitans sp.]